MKRRLFVLLIVATLGAPALAGSSDSQSSFARERAGIPFKPVPLAPALQQYAHNLESTARILDERAQALDNNARALAAAQRAHRVLAIPPIPLPEVHLPPAPLPGPPRFSPSLDDWLQAILNAARTEKKPATQAAMLRSAAATLRSAMQALAQSAVVPPHGVAPTLASILAQPAYHERESTNEAQVRKSWWNLFLEWLASMLERLFRGLFGAASATPMFARIVAVATIAIIGLLVMLVAYRLAHYVLGRRRMSRAADAGELLPERAAASELYDRALAAAAEGRYAIAISLAFRASLMRLEGSGLVTYDAARTAGEYRQAVRRARAAAAPPFDDLARTFTIATYAAAPAGESDWRTAEGAYRRFEASTA